MKTPFRKAAPILGVLLLACAVLVMIKSTRSSPDGKEEMSREPTARSGNGTNAGETSGQSGGETAPSPEGEPIGRTKTKERPVETDLDKKRKERHRLVETLKIYQGQGLGERHPSMVKLMDELKKVEAEITAAGGDVGKAAE